MAWSRRPGGSMPRWRRASGPRPAWILANSSWPVIPVMRSSGRVGVGVGRGQPLTPHSGEDAAEPIGDISHPEVFGGVTGKIGNHRPARCQVLRIAEDFRFADLPEHD